MKQQWIIEWKNPKEELPGDNSGIIIFYEGDQYQEEEPHIGEFRKVVDWDIEGLQEDSFYCKDLACEKYYKVDEVYRWAWLFKYE